MTSCKAKSCKYGNGPESPPNAFGRLWRAILDFQMLGRWQEGGGGEGERKRAIFNLYLIYSKRQLRTIIRNFKFDFELLPVILALLYTGRNNHCTFFIIFN